MKAIISCLVLSTGTAMGSLIAMASYNGFRHNCKRLAYNVLMVQFNLG